MSSPRTSDSAVSTPGSSSSCANTGASFEPQPRPGAALQVRPRRRRMRSTVDAASVYREKSRPAAYCGCAVGTLDASAQLVQTNVDVLARDDLVEVDDAWHHERDALRRAVRRIRSDEAEDGKDAVQLGRTDCQRDAHLQRTAAQVRRYRRAEDDTAAVGLVLKQLRRVPGTAQAAAATCEHMRETSFGLDRFRVDRERPLACYRDAITVRCLGAIGALHFEEEGLWFVVGVRRRRYQQGRRESDRCDERDVPTHCSLRDGSPSGTRL